MSDAHHFVVPISGGKDSTATAVWLNENEPRDYTYVCTPTGNELPDWYIGRPVARLLAGTGTAEITRLCVVEGNEHAASWLYARAKRLAQAWGFDRVVTYTVPILGERGSSLRAAGFTERGETAGGSWSRASRQRTDKHPTQPKMAWEAPAHE